MTSNYPTSVDPEIPTLRDDVDGFRANALQHIADMVLGVQPLLGTGLGDTTSDPGEGGSKKFGNLSQAMQSLFRFETGVIDFTYAPGLGEADAQPAKTINLAFGRFLTPPFVLIQTIECHQDSGPSGMGAGSPSANGYRESKIFPVNITNRSFGIAISSRAVGEVPSFGSTKIVAHWLAFEPPFGFAERDDSSTG